MREWLRRRRKKGDSDVEKAYHIAVSHTFAALSLRPVDDVKVVISKLEKKGIEKRQAHWLVFFVSSAASHYFMKAASVPWPQSYVIRNRDGTSESKKFLESPIYLAAVEFIASNVDRSNTEDLATVASRDPSLRALTAMIKKGTPPEECEVLDTIVPNYDEL